MPTQKELESLQAGTNALTAQAAEKDRLLTNLIMGHKNKLDEMGVGHGYDVENAAKAHDYKNDETTVTQREQGKRERQNYRDKIATDIGGVGDQRLREFLQPGAQLKVGDISLGKESNQKLALTPAQDAAEKAAGKMVADYEANGGHTTINKNLEQVETVKNELQDPATGKSKRTGWDRFVGAMTSGHPGAMGMLSSAEKSRRDRARNAAIMIAKSTDPNPTETQVENIFGQIYDPSSNDADNLARIERFHTEQQGIANQREATAQKYRTTGYATVGGVPSTIPFSGHDTQTVDVPSTKRVPGDNAHAEAVGGAPAGQVNVNTGATRPAAPPKAPLGPQAPVDPLTRLQQLRQKAAGLGR